MTSPRAAELIRLLGMQPHPEGGYFVQTFRSPQQVAPADGRGARSALTTIYFLLPHGAVSRWHRVRSDEVWHFHEGAPMDLLEMPADASDVIAHRLGPFGASQAPMRTIAAGHWQAARTTGDYTLVGCTVGPGFEFDDFAMLADDPRLAMRVRSAFPHVAILV